MVGAKQGMICGNPLGSCRHFRVGTAFRNRYSDSGSGIITLQLAGASLSSNR
jgi:hypothetical protein